VANVLAQSALVMQATTAVRQRSETIETIRDNKPPHLRSRTSRCFRRRTIGIDRRSRPKASTRLRPVVKRTRRLAGIGIQRDHPPDRDLRHDEFRCYFK
jgi:hypothetical protein